MMNDNNLISSNFQNDSIPYIDPNININCIDRTGTEFIFPLQYSTETYTPPNIYDSGNKLENIDEFSNLNNNSINNFIKQHPFNDNNPDSQINYDENNNNEEQQNIFNNDGNNNNDEHKLNNNINNNNMNINEEELEDQIYDNNDNNINRVCYGITEAKPKNKKRKLNYKKIPGRRRYGEQRIVNHTKTSNDNGFNKVVIRGVKNTHKLVKKVILYVVKSKHKKIKKKLNMPTLTKFLKNDISAKADLLKEPLLNFYQNYSHPRRKGDKNNSEIINNLIKFEENENKGNKLSILFSIPFNVFLEAFLGDGKIKIEEQIFELDETLQESFNDEKDFYSKDNKNNIKNYIEEVMKKERHRRAKRANE